MKRVYTASNLPEAHILADLLADRGIRTRIFNANASSLAGELPIDAALPQLWVEDPGDASRAREVIEAFFRAGTLGPALKCPACGEENPASFDLCWSCGAGLEK
jgi:Putative prokaryotic signal transducing protein